MSTMEMELEKAPSDQRLAFDSAYDKLAQTVRNFSREKLILEETITGHVATAAALESSLSDKNMENEALVEENRRLVSQHEDDAATRLGLDAVVGNVADKQAVLSETLTQFQLMSEGVDSKFKESLEFLESLKLRHTQMFNYIGELRTTFAKEAEEARTEYQTSLDAYTKLVAEGESHMSQLKVQCEEKNAQIQELHQTIVTAQAENTAQVQRLMASLSLSETQAATLENKLAISGETLGEKVKQIDDLILRFKEASAESEAQLDGYRKLLEESEHSVRVLTKENESKDVQIQDLSQTLASSRAENQAQVEGLEGSIAEVEGNVMSLKEQVASRDADLEEKSKKIDDLVAEFKKSSEYSEAELEAYRHQLEEKEAKIMDLSETMVAAKSENLTAVQNWKESLALADANFISLQNRVISIEESLVEKVKTIEDLIAQSKESLAQSETRLQEVLKQVEQKDAQIQDLSQTMATIQAENLTQIQNLEGCLATAEGNVASLREQVASRDAALEEKIKKMNDLKTQFEEASAQSEAGLREVCQLLEEKDVALVEVRKSSEEKDSEIQTLSERMAAATAENLSVVQNLMDSMSVADAKVATLQDQLICKGDALEEKVKEMANLNSKFKEASKESEAQLEKCHKKMEELRLTVSVKEGKIQDLLEKIRAAEEEHEAQVKNYKLTLSAADTHVATLQDKLLSRNRTAAEKNASRSPAEKVVSRSPSEKPVSRSPSEKPVPRTPSGILKTNASFTTGLHGNNRVSRSDATKAESRKTKLYVPLSLSSSSDEEPSIGEVDKTFKMPLKRSRLSDKQNGNKKNSIRDSLPISASIVSSPSTPLRQTKSVPNRCYPGKAPTSVSPYKFFKHRVETATEPEKS